MTHSFSFSDSYGLPFFVFFTVGISEYSGKLIDVYFRANNRTLTLAEGRTWRIFTLPSVKNRLTRLEGKKGLLRRREVLLAFHY